jgi:hypothetical protein
MTTRQRTDLGLTVSMMQNLLNDFQVALEQDSLDEWASAVRGLAEYMAQRHKVVHLDDEN